jgi:hypothetical protein
VFEEAIRAVIGGPVEAGAADANGNASGASGSSSSDSNKKKCSIL